MTVYRVAVPLMVVAKVDVLDDQRTSSAVGQSGRSRRNERRAGRGRIQQRAYTGIGSGRHGGGQRICITDIVIGQKGATTGTCSAACRATGVGVAVAMVEQQNGKGREGEHEAEAASTVDQEGKHS